MIPNLVLFFTGPPRCSLDCLVSPPRLSPPDSLHRPTGLHRRPGRAATFYSDPRQNRDLMVKKARNKRQAVSHGIHAGLHVHLKRHLTFTVGCWGTSLRRTERVVKKVRSKVRVCAPPKKQVCNNATLPTSRPIRGQMTLTCVKKLSAPSPIDGFLLHTSVCKDDLNRRSYPKAEGWHDCCSTPLSSGTVKHKHARLP